MAPFPSYHVAPFSIEPSHKPTPLLESWIKTETSVTGIIAKAFLLGALLGLIQSCAVGGWYFCIHWYYAEPGEDYHSLHMPELRDFCLRLRPRGGFRAFARRRLRLFFMGREERTIGSRTDDDEIADVELQQGVNQGINQRDERPVFQGLFMFHHPTIPVPLSPQQTSATPGVIVTPPLLTPLPALPPARPRDIAAENAQNARVRQQTINRIGCPTERALQQEFERNLREIERRAERSPATMPPIGPNGHFTPRDSIDAVRSRQSEETISRTSFWSRIRCRLF